MKREKKSKDIKKDYKVPEQLQGKVRELIEVARNKKLTDLQYWKHLYLIHRVAKKQSLHPEGYVSMDAKNMQELLGKDYNKYLKSIEDAGILESLKDEKGRALYSKREQASKQYRLTDTFRFEPTVMIEGGERVQLSRPKKDMGDFNTKRMLKDIGFPEYAFMRDCLHQLTIDVEAAEAECKKWFEEGALVKGKKIELKYYNRLLSNIDKISGDLIKFKIKFGGRIFTYIVEAPKPIRYFLKLKGYDGELMHSDLTSAHILLAIPLMKSYETTAEGREELDRVIKMIASKEFYKTITEQLRAEGVSRISKKGKTDFISKVWNAKEKDIAKYSKYRLTFKMLYPTYFEFIESFKQGENGSRDFAERMTKIETKLFINTIVRRIITDLGKKTFVATIHDALVYREEDREAIERIMDEEVYNLTGIRGMVSTTTLKEESMKVLTFVTPKKVKKTPITEPKVQAASNIIEKVESERLIAKEERDVKQLNLDDLKDLPDDELLRLVPVPQRELSYEELISFSDTETFVYYKTFAMKKAS